MELTKKFIYKEVDCLLKKQKETYIHSKEIALAFSNNERQIVNGYQGRQLLEMLQNADDSGATEITITFTDNTLTISDNGQGFSLEGIQSLFIPNCSSKANCSDNIGNKGIGFRSILNWSNDIVIRTKDCKLYFSKTIAEEYAKELYGIEDYENIVRKRGLGVKEIPFPLLGVCELQEMSETKTGTDIIMTCFENKHNEIAEQLKLIENHFLLFTKNLKKVTINNYEFLREQGNICVCDNYFVTQTKIKGNGLFEEWRVFERNGEYEESIEIHSNDRKYTIKIALPNEEYDYRKVLYNYFPMEEYLGFPCLIHCTSDTDSNRNYLNDNAQNYFLLNETADFLVEIAGILKKENYPSTWAPVNLLLSNLDNNKFSSLGSRMKMVILDKIEKTLDTLELFPTNGGDYKKKRDCYFYGDDINKFFKLYSQELPDFLLCENIPQALCIKNKQYEYDDFISKIDSISSSIDKIDERVNLISILSRIYRDYNQDNKKFSLLVNENNELINNNIVGYIGKEKETKYDVPTYLKVDFVDSELFSLLKDKVDYKLDSDKDTVPRAIARSLRGIVNIRSYDLDNILDQIESYSKSLSDTEKIKQSVVDLFHIYQATGFKKELKINLVNRNNEITPSDELFFGDDFNFPDKLEMIYEGIYTDSQYLACPEFWGLQEEDYSCLQNFFIKLGVSKYYRINFEKKSSNKEFLNHLKEYYNKDIDIEHWALRVEDYQSFSNFDAIIKMTFEQTIILFSHFDDIRNQIAPNTLSHVYKDISRNRDDKWLPLTGIRYQLQKLWTTEKDFCVISCVDGIAIVGKKVDSKLTFISEEKRSFVMDVLKSIAYDFSKHSLKENVNVLNKLNDWDSLGLQAQKIYRSVYKDTSDKYNMTGQTLYLYAKNIDKLKCDYCRASDIYYSDNLVLPKTLMLKRNIMQFVYPSRRGIDKVTEFFGVRKMSELKLKIDKNKISINHLDKDFELFINDIKPFILYHRLDSIDKYDKKTLAATIKKLKIRLVDVCCCFIGDEIEPYQLSAFEYVNCDNCFYMLIPDDIDAVESLCKKAQFCSAIAEIIGMTFNLAKDEDYVNMVHDFNFYKDSLSHSDFYEDRINECYALLGIQISERDFWNRIFLYRGEPELPSQTSAKDLENAIDRLGINIKDLHLLEIDYKDWSTYDSIVLLKRLCENFSDNKILEHVNLYKFHEREFGKYKNRLMQRFEYSLWEKLRYESKEQQANYISIIYDFKNLKGLNIQEYEHSFVEDYEMIIKNWAFIQFNVKIGEVEEAVKCLYEDIEPEIKVLDEHMKSLAFFDNNRDILQENIDKYENNKSKEIINGNQDKDIKILAIKPTILDYSKISPQGDRKKKKYRESKTIEKPGRNFNTQNEEQKTKDGKDAEALVNTYLLQNPKQYKNVKWMSSAGRLQAVQGDSAGYDFSYIDENDIENYLEVKCSSSNRFFLSANEWKVAQDNVDNYHIALVNGTNITIIKCFFKEKNRYSEKVDTYEISFKIK